MFAGVYRNDFLCEPAVAAMLAGELGINSDARSPDDKRTFVFDVFNGALGFLNACHVAVQMIRVGKHKNVMVVASEIENNAALQPERLLGIKEIGSAVILDEATDGRSGFGNFVFRYDTRHMNAFVSHAGQDPQVGRACLYFEKDPDIETHYLQCIPEAVAELLAIEGLGLGRITAMFPPQMSPSFVSALSEQMGVPRAKFVDLADDGKDLYTSSAAYALRHALEQKRVGPGDVGLIIGVGSGVQVGCAIYYF
jgi:3-oxoacyl-[acyl-carrier-protein] synthase III